MSRKVLSVLLILALVLSGVCAFAEADKTVIQFYFPVQLGGAAANMIEQFVGEFEQQNPDIDVDAIFCGNYADTMTKLTLALEGNQAPQLCILDQRLLTLISMDAVVCLDDYIQADGGDELLNDFYPAYLESGIYEGAHYALPFQRSVLAMYYNKDHFTEVGLDPVADYEEGGSLLHSEGLFSVPEAAGLTVLDDAGNVERWGVMIANSSGWAQQSMCITASTDGSNTFNPDGTEVYFNTPAVKRALEFMMELKTVGASPEGVIDEGIMPSSFIEGAVSIIAVSSGNLTNINNSVDFNYGVCVMPADGTDAGASIGGGGDMYMIKCDSTTQAQYDATWRFMRFMSDPEQQARWSVGTGYIASRVSAKDTEVMKNYFAEVPQAAVMYDILNNAYRQTSVFASSEIGDLFVNMFTSVALGESTIDDAMAYAQSEADYILEEYR